MVDKIKLFYLSFSKILKHVDFILTLFDIMIILQNVDQIKLKIETNKGKLIGHEYPQNSFSIKLWAHIVQLILDQAFHN